MITRMQQKTYAILETVLYEKKMNGCKKVISENSMNPLRITINCKEMVKL